MAVESVSNWKSLLAPAFERKPAAFQILDVQVVDELPHALDTSGDGFKGEDFLLNVAELEPDEGGSAAAHRKCTVLLFGCTETGNSVLARVSGFSPSLFFEIPSYGDASLRRNIASKCGVPENMLRFKRVKRKNMYGWVPESRDHPTKRKEHAYLQVFFPTIASMRRAARNFRVHEDKVTVDTKFMDEFDLVPSGWVEIKRCSSVESGRISHCALEIALHAGDLAPLAERSDIAPLMTANVDIECVSDVGAFPDAANLKDEISHIGVVLWRVGTPKDRVVKVCYVNTQKCSEIPGGYVVRFDDERAMLRGFRSDFIDIDPDVLVTYNGFGFDLPYLFKRAELHRLDDFFYLDRIITRRCEAGFKELSSSALGNNDLFLIDMFGRSNLDVFHWVKAREKLESYKLDSVAEHFLGDKKIDMDYKELFRMVKFGDANDMAEVGRYCLQDCNLLVLLAVRLQIFAGNVEMSRVCHTPMEMLVTRGQQVKVINQLVWYGHRMERRDDGEGGYIMNTPASFSGGKEDSYEGATVIDAKASYYKEPIATLDFMSLYPSIILANNFCFSTLVQDPAHLGIEGVDYVHIEVTPEKKYWWARNMPGVIPVMLRALLKARKDAKKLMNAAAARCEEAKQELKAAEASGDASSIEQASIKLERAQIDKSVYNARQQALKISANSIYGFTGAVKTGKYHCLGVADCTTFRAREMLHDTVRFVHEYTEGKCDVVYGDTDSVMVKFFEAHDVESAAAIGEKAADWITERFAEQTGTTDIVLEFEKVYMPYLLMRKKRYAGLMFERGKDGDMINTKLDAKGIELVRRDNCAIAKECQKNVLDALMYKMDSDLACEAVHAVMRKIVADEVPIMEYKLSKSRRKEYKSEDLPHINVCKKMAERNPGSEPQVGDRVPYVLLVLPHNNAKAKTWEKAEDIGYASQHPDECKVDRLYYVEHQIVNQIDALMHLVIGDVKQLFAPYITQLTLQQTNQRTLGDFFSIVPRKREASDAEESAAVVEEPSGVAAGAAADSLEDAMFNLSSSALARAPAKRPRQTKNRPRK